ncbi:MAG: DUF2703 domain-containing protein [Solirubrobacterales bacterium]
MSSHALAVPPPAESESEEITIDFLYLDLTTCTRCVGTDQSLETALDVVRDVLDATGAAVQVRKTLVETAVQARELGFVSSPTLRVNGRDIALELKESPCGSEPCGCGCDDDTACRVWTYRGEEYTQAPVGLIVDAVLGELYGGAARPDLPADQAYELPQNLVSFFADRGPASVDEVACCSPAEQGSCCEPSAKAECCAPSTGGGCAC